ncbi:hypothetical protein [Pseudomonas sp. B21-015]|nr:hypothetical protein [Pseudomonas sp. B21-015]
MKALIIQGFVISGIWLSLLPPRGSFLHFFDHLRNAALHGY